MKRFGIVAAVSPASGAVAGFHRHFRELIDGGAWFAPGAGTTYGQAALMDLEALRDEGMPSIDVIRCATINGTELMGWSDAVGEIAQGKFADIIALSADPLEDVTSLG